MMVSPLAIAVFSPASGALTDRIGPKGPSFAGLTLMGAGFLLMTLIGTGTTYAFLIAFLLMIGTGQSLFQPANNTIIMSSVPRSKLGVAGSVNSLVRNIGQITGVTFATTLLYALMSREADHAVTDYPVGNDAIFVHAMNAIYVTLGILAIAGAALTFLRFTKREVKRVR